MNPSKPETATVNADLAVVLGNKIHEVRFLWFHVYNIHMYLKAGIICRD